MPTRAMSLPSRSGPGELRVHTCALNARDLDSLAAQAVRSAPCVCDGEWVGEGPEGVRQLLEREFAVNDELYARLGDVDGEPTVLEFDGGGIQRATLRFQGDGSGRIQGLSIEHRPGNPVVRGLVPEPSA